MHVSLQVLKSQKPTHGKITGVHPRFSFLAKGPGLGCPRVWAKSAMLFGWPVSRNCYNRSSKTPLNWLWPYVAFMLTVIKTIVADEKTTHKRSRFSTTLGFKELASFAAESFEQLHKDEH